MMFTMRLHHVATRALARKHTQHQRRRPRPAGVTHERHGRDLDIFYPNMKAREKTHTALILPYTPVLKIKKNLS